MWMINFLFIYLFIFKLVKGGMKAVVWTDVFQTIVIFSAMVFVTIKGTIDNGGFSEVIQANTDTKRIELFKFVYKNLQLI